MESEPSRFSIERVVMTGVHETDAEQLHGSRLEHAIKQDHAKLPTSSAREQLNDAVLHDLAESILTNEQSSLAEV